MKLSTFATLNSLLEALLSHKIQQMRTLLILLVSLLTLSASQAQRGRRFTPIYGTDEEINRTLSFITENLLFDSLTYTRLGSLNGYVRCVFNVNEEGKIVDIKIAKGLSPWIDYEISTTMSTMPNMNPFINTKGERVKVKRDIYFTFGSKDDRGWGNPYLNKSEQTTASIEEQRRHIKDSIMKNNQAWSDFTTDNAKIALDGKSVYKPGILPNNPLQIKTPPTRPPVTITIKGSLDDKN